MYLFDKYRMVIAGELKSYLKTPTLFASTPHANTDDSGEDPESRRVIGKRGRSIVFSCTWNENRKKDIDEVSKAYGNKGSVDVETDAPSLSAAVGRVLIELWINPTTLGKKPMAVSPADNLTRESRETQFFHLNTTFEAHQKFATLSSKSPLSNGNIRVIGSRIAWYDARGGRNGRKSRAVVRIVMKPKRMNKWPLQEKWTARRQAERSD